MDCVPETISSLLYVSLWGFRLQLVFQALSKHFHLLWVLCLASVNTWFPWQFSVMELLGIAPDLQQTSWSLSILVHAFNFKLSWQHGQHWLMC